MRTSEVIMAMLFLVLAVVAGLTAISALQGDASQEYDYEYLQMVPLSDFGEPDAVAGCCEIVQYGDEQYVRMTGIGEISVVNGSSITEYTVGKAHLDLMLFTGQSNSLYYTDPQYYEGSSPLPPGVAFYLGTEDVYEDDSRAGRSTPLAREATLEESAFIDMTAPDGSVRVAGSYPTLMYDYFKATGHRVLVVNSGIGGVSINSFYKTTGSAHLWTISVLDRTEELADGLAELDPVAVLWSQGEQNIRATIDWYKPKLAAVVGYFTDGTFGYEFPKVLSSLPKHHGWESPIVPAQAQMEYAEENPDFVIASSLPLYLPDDVSGREGDPIHYSQQVYEWLGEAFARSASKTVTGKALPETLVYCPSLGAVDSLPVQVTAYGTSGRAVLVPVQWEDVPEEPGEHTVEGTISPPYGTEALNSLTTTAIVTVAEEEEEVI